jgi:sulfate permease, SulP family
MATTSDGVKQAEHRRFPILQGIVPTEKKQMRLDIVAGCTLAALGIPEVMGYTSIAGMPVVTGLYTILIPIAVFAVLGSSRHLVVGADSATAAIMAAGIGGMAATASSEYIALAGMSAIITGGLLIIARLIKLGFIADFLSRSVLIGFLTGVGIQVALGQVGDMLGVPAQSGRTLEKFFATLGDISEANWQTILVSASVIAVILGCKAISPKIPGALIAVIGSIVVSKILDLASYGVATVGKVQGGLPSFVFPSVSWSQFTDLLPTGAAIFVVILAQSAATSRAYAAKYEEQFDENVDLVGLGLANASAGLTGTFVVNGSPTKSQMVDGAGGRSQIPMLTTAVLVAMVLLFLTTPLQYMPVSTLASVVFIIGIELVDIAGMRRVLAARPDEFGIALITAAIVVVVGVEQAIVAAIIFSIIDHLRRSYHPNDSVIVEGTGGHAKAAPAEPGTQTEPGLVVYRFAASLYYANANRLNQEILALVDEVEPKVRWLVLDAGAVSDIDYSGGETLKQVHSELASRGVRLAIADVTPDVRAQLDRYGVSDLIEEDGYYETSGEAIDAFRGRPAD